MMPSRETRRAGLSARLTLRKENYSARNPAGISRRWLFMALALIALCALPARAAKYAGEFLEIGVGARALGLGGPKAGKAPNGVEL